MTNETQEQILKYNKELDTIEEILGNPTAQDGDILAADLGTLKGWLGRSATLTAEAQALYDYELGQTITELMRPWTREETDAWVIASGGMKAPEKPTPTIAEKMAKAQVCDVLKVYKRAERLNAALVHGIDAVRSLLSYEKELARNTDSGGSGYQCKGGNYGR